MKKQTLLRLLALLLCICLLCTFSLPVLADFGDFAGDDDYGGGDDGGGYDGGYDGGYSYSSSDGSADGNAYVFFLVIVLGLIVAAICSSSSGGGDRTGTIAELPDLEDIDRYSEIDPNFNAMKLTQKLSNLYIRMQQCWQAKDIEPLRPYFTDAYYSQLDRQLDSYRNRGVTNYIDRPAVLSVKLDGFCQKFGEDHIVATVKTRIVDYKIDDDTGALISGSRTAEKFMTYRWHLTRPTGQVTDSADGVRSVSCPHCGGPVALNETAKCPFCGSVVTAEPHDFVIAQIEGVSQRTV